MKILYRTQRQVEFADTDAAGMLHFAAFFRLMESVEHAFYRERGVPVSAWLNRGLGLPRVLARCDYRRAVRAESVLEIEMALAERFAERLTFRFRFACRAELVATGTVTVACAGLSGPTIAAAPFPEDWMRRLFDDDA